MDNNLTQLFKESGRIVAPADLPYRVFRKIDMRAKLEDKRDRYFWGSFFICSLAAFVWSADYAYAAFKASNFSTYFSIVFSDSSMAFRLFHDLGLSLVESLPLFSVVAVIASITFLLLSIRKFTKQHTHLFADATPHKA